MNKFTLGDTVFDLRYGFGKITGDNPGLNQIYFEYSENEQVEVFNKDGRRVFSDFAPSLLTIEEAAKLGYFPEKKIKKTVDVWVAFETVTKCAMEIFNDEKDAYKYVFLSENYDPNLTVVKTTLEWEVEE